MPERPRLTQRNTTQQREVAAMISSLRDGGGWDRVVCGFRDVTPTDTGTASRANLVWEIHSSVASPYLGQELGQLSVVEDKSQWPRGELR